MSKVTGITARTTLLAWTVTLLTLSIFVIFIIPEQKRDLQDGLEAKAQVVAAALQGEIAGAPVTEGYLVLVDHAQQVLSEDPAVNFLAFTKKDDGFSVIVDRNSWRVVPAIDDYWHPNDSRPTGYIEQVPLFNQRDYHFAGPLDYGRQQRGWIHVGLSLNSYDRSVIHIYRRTGLMAALCILLSLIASLLYARYFVAPILQLREVVEKVAGGDYTARAKIKNDDEIRQLANAFNHMADAVVQRNRIMESVRFTAQSLQSTHDWGHVIEQVLAKIGLAANASRVLIAEKHSGPDGADLRSIRFEWAAAEIEPWIHACQNRRLDEEGLKKLAARLAAGEMIVARHDPIQACAAMQPEGQPLSQIIAPIHIGELLWGVLVMQDCERDRNWGEAEKDSIRAIAEMLGASILRHKSQLELVAAKSDLERRVAERTRELSEQIVAKDQAHAALEEAKELAETTALQDPLTKLPNRRLFQTQLDLAISHAERNPDYLCALLYLDVDRFKIINDSLGHLAGDELLIEVAHRLESCLHNSLAPIACAHLEDIVARLGGDEFAVFLDGIRDVSDALRVANRIAEKLKAPFLLRGKQVAISASIGIALSASHYLAADDMLRDADTAMYRAKSSGPGACVLFDESMHLHAVERLQKESELRQGLQRDEFFLCYQPIVSLPDGKIEGFEALVRWLSPTRGEVPPAEFIPLTEETGLIVPLGAWVLREACTQVRRWQERYGGNFPLTVSVNISARQLAQPDFANMVKETLRETGVAGRNLRLELTESLAMEAPERIAPLLRELQQLDVRLSIDDFGTGYSSLKHLHRFSVDTLKIDKYFVGNMELNEKNLSIVRTIISLAHNLRMAVVAEGAENSAQINLLNSLNCDRAQGYFFSEPMQPAVIETWLAANPDFLMCPPALALPGAAKWATEG